MACKSEIAETIFGDADAFLCYLHKQMIRSISFIFKFIFGRFVLISVVSSFATSNFGLKWKNNLNILSGIYRYIIIYDAVYK